MSENFPFFLGNQFASSISFFTWIYELCFDFFTEKKKKQVKFSPILYDKWLPAFWVEIEQTGAEWVRHKEKKNQQHKQAFGEQRKKVEFSGHYQNWREDEDYKEKEADDDFTSNHIHSSCII